MAKIVVFTPSLSIGGIERVLLTYAQGLAANSQNVIYLTLNHNADFKAQPMPHLSFKDLGVTRLRKALKPFVKFLKDNNPEVIFCANNATLMVYLAKIISRSKVKIITSHHNYFKNYLGMSFTQTFVPKYIYPRCFKIIAVSEGIKNMLINDFNINSNKIHSISNPIDIQNILNQANEAVDNLPDNYFLFVGRFDKVKNIPLLLKAFKKFVLKYPTFKLLLIGGGEEQATIVNCIHELQLVHAVDILGVKSNPFPYINKTNAVILSSVSEAFPTVLLEALALGKTIVSTPTQGALDILKNGEFGYLTTEIDNVDALYEQLEKAYLSPLNAQKQQQYVNDNYNITIKVSEFNALWQ